MGAGSGSSCSPELTLRVVQISVMVRMIVQIESPEIALHVVRALCASAGGKMVPSITAKTPTRSG
jgi:hypothetical protein